MKTPASTPRLEMPPVAPAAPKVRPHLVELPTPPDNTPPTGLRIRPRTREVSAVILRPEERAKLERHNARIGKPLQRVLMRILTIWVIAPALQVALRVMFRLRVEGRERLEEVRNRSGIFVIRHFYETDPFVSLFTIGWPLAVRRPHLSAFTLASRIWTRSFWMRCISWPLGVMGLSRGLGPQQSATERAVQLLRRGEQRNIVCIFPTGPIGRRKTFSLGNGAGYIAVQCPNLPVFAVTMVGLQEFRWRDVLLLKRPPLHVVVCRPFYGREVTATETDCREDRVCDLVAARWAEEELRIAGGDHPGGSRG
jgi:1-acyl-sn-glycerol-3-phosphate acyltransferase